MSLAKNVLAGHTGKWLETGLRLLFVLLVLSVANAAADEPQIRMQLDREQIYFGESARLNIIVSDANDPPEIGLSSIEDDFSVQFLGRSESRSQQIVVSNGRPQVSNTIQFVYPYRLTPKRAGRFKIPSLTVLADGVNVTAQGVQLKVIAPKKQELVLLETSSTPKTVYPSQDVTIRLRVLVKAIPDSRYSNRDPVSIAAKRALTIPWFSSDSIANSLNPLLSLQEVVSPLIEDRPQYGFEINGLSQREGFFSTRTLTFCSKPQREMRADDSGKETEYWVYTFERTFTPTEPGEFSFGPVICKGNFINTVDEDGTADAEQVYAVSPTYKLRVKDIPLKGRPDSYIGAFGKFDFESQLSPVSARVGDPMTLTLTLRGEGALKQAIPPDINKIPAVAANFKTYEATQDTSENYRRFTYSVRPINTEVKSFPPVSIAYFDVDAGDFVTKTSSEIAIKVIDGEALSTSDITSAPKDAAESGIETNAAGLFGNQTDPATLRNQSVNVRNWMYAWAGLLSFWGAGSVVIRRLHRRRGDTSGMRRRKAVVRARKALSAVDAHGDSSLIDGVRSSVVGLVADVVECNESGLATRDVTEHLRDLQLTADEIQPVTQFLDQCDASRYGGGTDSDELKSAANQVLDGLIQAFSKRKLLR